METNETFSIIEGCFDPRDAKEILINMLSNKIQFHQKRNFSSVERYGIADTNTINRINELKNTLENILKLISQAEQSNSLLLISSKINITLK